MATKEIFPLLRLLLQFRIDIFHPTLMSFIFPIFLYRDLDKTANTVNIRWNTIIFILFIFFSIIFSIWNLHLWRCPTFNLWEVVEPLGIRVRRTRHNSLQNHHHNIHSHRCTHKSQIEPSKVFQNPPEPALSGIDTEKSRSEHSQSWSLHNSDSLFFWARLQISNP